MSDDHSDYDCRKASDELDAFVRGDLPIEAASRMEQHLEHCGHCGQVARYEQAFRQRLRQLGQGCCPEQVRQRIERLIDQDDAG